MPFHGGQLRRRGLYNLYVVNRLLAIAVFLIGACSAIDAQDAASHLRNPADAIVKPSQC